MQTIQGRKRAVDTLNHAYREASKLPTYEAQMTATAIAFEVYDATWRAIQRHQRNVWRKG